MYSINFEEKPTDEEIQVLERGIEEFTQAAFENRTGKSLTFFLRDENQEIVGGVYGKISSFGWLYVSLLWISPKIRGGGYGIELMKKIEREAVKNDCHHAYLDTFSFQAPEFYQKLGYEIFAELKDFPNGHSRIFLKKTLINR